LFDIDRPVQEDGGKSNLLQTQLIVTIDLQKAAYISTAVRYHKSLASWPTRALYTVQQ